MFLSGSMLYRMIISFVLHSNARYSESSKAVLQHWVGIETSRFLCLNKSAGERASLESSRLLASCVHMGKVYGKVVVLCSVLWLKLDMSSLRTELGNYTVIVVESV